MKKQFKRLTAVEWLVNEANLLENNGWIISLIDQAKEMEKQQIIDAFNEAEDKCEYFIEEHAYQRYYRLSEQYYNETFKSE
jgi:hypothetical protein